MNLIRILPAILVVVLWSCRTKTENISYPDVPGYDLKDPVMIRLSADLDEISGIVYYAKDSSIFAINDELGVLYKIYVRSKVKIDKWKFAEDADYEDLALVNNTFYALQSNGNIKCFRFISKDSIAIDNCQLPVMGYNNFETLYFDSLTERLMLVCKECQGDKDNSASVYTFNPYDQSFISDPVFSFDFSNAARETGNRRARFKPSAAAIHPITGDIYIISSEAKALTIAGKKGEVKKIYELDPRLFKQPEGLAFTPAGDLIICNESGDIGAADILIFTYKPELNEKG